MNSEQSKGAEQAAETRKSFENWWGDPVESLIPGSKAMYLWQGWQAAREPQEQLATSGEPLTEALIAASGFWDEGRHFLAGVRYAEGWYGVGQAVSARPPSVESAVPRATQPSAEPALTDDPYHYGKLLCEAEGGWWDRNDQTRCAMYEEDARHFLRLALTPAPKGDESPPDPI